MDLSYGEDNEVFRGSVREFLSEHWKPTSAQPGDISAAIVSFRRKATEHGFLYRAVPRRYGGSEQPADIVKAQIIREEFRAVRAPLEVAGNGMAMFVPTLLEWGTEWQKDIFIRPIVEGECEWAQGYSEPGTGSDLASVRTRGELEDGQWIINGQKIWTSHAERSQFMFALVRTEPAAAKHAGISYLLFDLRQPGVTIRPLKQMTGQTEFCQVFLDDVRTPADWIVGKRGEGWFVSRSTLQHERASIGTASVSENLLAKLVKLARETIRLGRPAIEDTEIRQALAALEGWILAQKYSEFRQFSLAAHGRKPGSIALMNKILRTEVGHEVARLALELIDDNVLRQPDFAHAGSPRGQEKWLDQIMGSLGISIAGGTSNIQRNIIAERGLGLPRGTEIGAAE